jgi:hypothetical protein
MMEFVSWYDDIPKIMEKQKMFQTTNQLASLFIIQWDFNGIQTAPGGKKIVG